MIAHQGESVRLKDRAPGPAAPPPPPPPAAMIDRLVHHADVIALKGDSYRLKDRDLGRVPTAASTED